MSDKITCLTALSYSNPNSPLHRVRAGEEEVMELKMLACQEGMERGSDLSFSGQLFRVRSKPMDMPDLITSTNHSLPHVAVLSLEYFDPSSQKNWCLATLPLPETVRWVRNVKEYPLLFKI